MKKLIFIIFLLFLLGCNSQTSVCFEEKCFNVEISDNDIERSVGLMYRTSLSENNGMLFIFESQGIYSFWMKNTFIPLDIIWVHENFKIVYIYENAQPCRESCNSITPNKDAKYVLEINSGLAEKYKMKVGDRTEIKY